MRKIARKLNVSEAVLEICKKASCRVYAVGGFVRNAVAGLPTGEVDLAGEALPQDLGLEGEYSVRVVNRRLGTAVIACGAERFEYTPFRKESYNKGGAHSPSGVEFGVRLQADAGRRDFCANALYYSPLDNEIIDCLGGFEDAQQRVLRQVDERVFESDGLRLLRLVRIAAQNGFDIESRTLECAKSQAFNLKDISKERVAAELCHILNADCVHNIADAHYRGVLLLGELGLYPYIIPQIERLKGLAQSSNHVFDAYHHTMQVVKYAAPQVRLAALLHDVGKAECQYVNGAFINHAEVGERICRQALGNKGLKLPNALVDKVSRLVRHHMFDTDGSCTEQEVRLFVCQNLDILDDLLELIRADILGTGTLKLPKELRLASVRRKMIEQGAPFNVGQLMVNGMDIVNLGADGAKVGNILKKLWIDCVNNPCYNERELLLNAAKEIIKEHLEQP